MNTQAPDGGSPDDSFIQRQGGHQLIGGSSGRHVQDFFITEKLEVPAPVGVRNISNNTVFQLSQLGARLNPAKMFQTYKVKKIQEVYYYAGHLSTQQSQPNLLLFRCPYSRDPFNNTGNQDIDPRYLPGCQSKYINTGRNSGTPAAENSDTEGDQPQMLKVTNEHPMYSLNATESSGVAIGGQVYTDGHLSLTSRVGLDTTAWYGFINFWDLIATTTAETIYFFDVVRKVTIEFEGIRWGLNDIIVPSSPSLGPDMASAKHGCSPFLYDSTMSLSEVLRDRTRGGRDSNEQLQASPRVHSDVGAKIEAISRRLDPFISGLGKASDSLLRQHDPHASHSSLQEISEEEWALIRDRRAATSGKRQRQDDQGEQHQVRKVLKDDKGRSKVQSLIRDLSRPSSPNTQVDEDEACPSPRNYVSLHLGSSRNREDIDCDEILACSCSSQP